MAPCERCQEQLLDSLYGLLDDTEAKALQVHLQTCADCQQALTRAKRQQKLLSAAAQVIREVTPFAAPGYATVGEAAPSSLPVAQESAAAANAGEILPFPATSAASATAPAKRHPLKRYWPAWAAAAALLAAVIGGQQLYHQGHEERSQAVTQSRKELAAIDAQFASLKKDVAAKTVHAKAGLRESQLHVHAVGPTYYHPAVPGECRVVTRSVDGKLTPAEVRLEIVDEKGEVLVHKKVQSEGEVTLTVPAGLELKAPAKLVLDAKAGKARERIEETLLPAPVVHATHLALNKNTYHVGELMFFRALTLERVSHEPPKESVPLHFTLVNEQGKPVMDLAAMTGPGGISAGNFAITDDLPGGLYTVHVRAGEKAPETVLGSVMPVEIIRDALEMEFDRAKYRAGDTVNIVARPKAGKSGRKGGGDKAEKAGDKGGSPYGLRIVADGKQIPATNGGAFGPDLTQKITADANGNALVQFKLPAKMERGEVFVELEKKTAAGGERFVQPVPVVPSDFAIDFFPEGGNLVKDVPNTLYWRSRSPGGAAVDLDSIVVSTAKGVVHKSEGKEGLGCFSFTPDSKENYTVTLNSELLPGGKLDIVNPFQSMPLVTDGVALHVTEPVAKAGTPVKAVLRNPGVEKRVLLVASCRGVVFGQQVLALKKGDNPAAVSVPAGVDGLLRLTLLDVVGEMDEGYSKVRPLAERLVFRAPREHLEVTCSTDKTTPLHPGRNVRVDVDVVDEAKKSSEAWITMAVVDERVRSPYSEANLPAFFNVATEIANGEDLDQALILLNSKKGKDAATALDLYLSTYGWRRFAPEGGLTVARLDEELKAGEKTDKKPTRLSLAIFSRENKPLADQYTDYQEALAETLTALDRKANQERGEGLEKRERALASLRAAGQDLDHYKVQPEVYLRRAMGIALAILLAGGALGLLWAVYRHARGAQPRPALAVSVGCLACAFALYLGGKQLLSEMIGENTTPTVAGLNRPDWPEFAQAAQKPSGKRPDSTALGPFALAKEVMDLKDLAEREPITLSLARAAVTDQPASTEPRRDQDNKSKGYTERSDRAFDAVPVEPYFQNDEMQSRFKTATEVQRRLSEPGKSKDKEGKGSRDEPLITLPAPSTSYGPAASDGREKDTVKESAKKDGKKDLGGDDKREEEEMLGLLVREYVNKNFPLRPTFQDTVLWHPALFVEKGKAQVSFDLSPEVPSYRVLLFANSPSGRLGFYEGRLEVLKDTGR